MGYLISPSVVVTQLLRHWRQGRTGLTEFIQREQLDLNDHKEPLWVRRRKGQVAVPSSSPFFTVIFCSGCSPNNRHSLLQLNQTALNFKEFLCCHWEIKWGTVPSILSALSTSLFSSFVIRESMQLMNYSHLIKQKKIIRHNLSRLNT